MVSASRYDSRNLRRWFLALHGTEYRPCPRPVPCQASDGTYENNRPAVPQSRQWRNEWKLAAVVPCSEHPLYRMQVDIMQRCIDTWEGCTLYGVLRNLFCSPPLWLWLCCWLWHFGTSQQLKVRIVGGGWKGDKGIMEYLGRNETPHVLPVESLTSSFLLS